MIVHCHHHCWTKLFKVHTKSPSFRVVPGTQPLLKSCLITQVYTRYLSLRLPLLCCQRSSNGCLLGSTRIEQEPIVLTTVYPDNFCYHPICRALQTTHRQTVKTYLHSRLHEGGGFKGWGCIPIMKMGETDVIQHIPLPYINVQAKNILPIHHHALTALYLSVILIILEILQL